MEFRKFFDSHCHLDFSEFAHDRLRVVEKAQNAGVQACLVPGVSYSQSQQFAWLKDCAQIALYRGVGLHPYFIEEHQEEHLAWVEQELQQHSQLAVGEIGLDATCAQYEWQQHLFKAQLELAARYQRPMILHHRRSQADLLKIIKPYLSQLPVQPGILHAFSGSTEQAKQWVELGFKLGVGGVITYARANKTRTAIAKAPLASLVLETDAPSMPLSGKQGQRNEPQNVAAVFTALCELRPEAPAEIAQALWQNTMDVVAPLGSFTSIG